MRMTKNVSYGRPCVPLNDRIIRNRSPDGTKDPNLKNRIKMAEQLKLSEEEKTQIMKGEICEICFALF